MSGTFRTMQVPAASGNRQEGFAETADASNPVASGEEMSLVTTNSTQSTA
jgi:hypothetical protein